MGWLSVAMAALLITKPRAAAKRIMGFMGHLLWSVC
jgi:hypothetical protein